MDELLDLIDKRWLGLNLVLSLLLLCQIWAANRSRKRCLKLEEEYRKEVEDWQDSWDSR